VALAAHAVVAVAVVSGQVVMVADSVWVEMAARHRQVTVGMARRVMAARVVAVARVD
jgi:hypothetical protein